LKEDAGIFSESTASPPQQEWRGYTAWVIDAPRGETGISPQYDLSQPEEYVIQLSQPISDDPKNGVGEVEPAEDNCDTVIFGAVLCALALNLVILDENSWSLDKCPNAEHRREEAASYESPFPLWSRGARGFKSSSDCPGSACQINESMRGQTNERTGKCAYRQFDAAVYPYFAHNFRDVGFNGTLYNPKWCTDFLVGKSRHQHFQDLFLSLSNSLVGSGSHALRLVNGKFYEHGECTPRNPN
jgi:hypothetical protein